MKSAGNHQMNHQAILAGELPHDPLALPPDILNRLSFEPLHWRLKGPQQERTANYNSFECLPQQHASQGDEITFQIGKLGHGGFESTAASRRSLAGRLRFRG